MGVKIASGRMLLLMEGGLMNEDHEFNGVDEFCGLNTVTVSRDPSLRHCADITFLGWGFLIIKGRFVGYALFILMKVTLFGFYLLLIIFLTIQ